MQENSDGIRRYAGTALASGPDLHRSSQVTGHGAKFGRKKEEAIAALLSQRNIEEAARATGIGTNTLLRWLQLPEFAAEYRRARRDAFSQSVARLQQASGAAVSTLLKVMVDQNTPASSRVRAAHCVLDHAAQALEVEDIEVRVSALERAAEASKSAR
jgi:transposase-like protein